MQLFLYFTLTGITVMLITSPLFAKPSDLDAGFGTTGHVITSLGGESYVNALTVQADGKILAAGYTTNGTDTDIALVRYNADGSLDTGFNGYGIVLSPLGLENEYATDIAVQPNGKILVSGAMVIGTIAEFVIVRYNSDGSLDTSFGTGGYTHTPIGSSHAFGRALALQADGKILVAGNTVEGTVTALALVRYTSSGILDTTFGGGIVTTSIGIGNTSVASIAVQSDGKVLIAGTSSNNVTNEDFTIVRYAADGSLDNSFGSGGVLISPHSLDYDYARAIALQPDGKIVVAGTARDGSIDDFALMRIDSDGTLDTTFGNNGHVLTQVGNGNAYARALALQPDGKILTAGLTLGAHSHQYDDEFVLARYTTSGDLDTSFNNSGLLYMPYGLDREYSLALQADGKVLTAGIMSEVANAEFSLSRFLLKDDNDDGIAEAWDLTPDAFTFTDVTDVAPDSLQTSNLITISGLEAGVYVPLQIVNGEYALSGSTTYSNAPAWVHNDEQINVRHTSAAGAGLSIHTTLTVGGLRSLNNQALIVGAVTIDTFTSTTAPVDNSPSNGSSDSSGGGGAFSFLLLFVLCFFAFTSRRHKAKTYTE